MSRYDRSSVLLGAAAFIVPLTLYIITLRPDIGFWDTGEMQTVPWIAGIAHPTGFPAFVLGGFAFAHLVPIGPVAWRMTCFSATAMALAAWALFAAARELRLAQPTALLAASVFATTTLAWSRGTRTEVHALAIGTMSVAVWIGLRFLRTRDLRLLPLGALALSLSLAVHPVAIFLLPLMCGWALLGIFTSARNAQGPPPILPTQKLLLTCVAAICVGPLLYLYIPLRSMWLSHMSIDPTLSLGIPPGRPYWDYGHPSTLDGLWRELSGSDFTVGGGLSGIFNLETYAKLPTAFFADAAQAFGGHGLIAFTIIGLIATAMRIGIVETLLFALFGFLAVPFASSYSSESDIQRYFLLAYWCIALFVAAGIEMTTTIVVYRLRSLLPSANRFWRSLRYAVPALLLACIAATNIATNWQNMQNQHHDTEARGFIDRVLAVTPPNAVIVSVWTYATPLAYAAYVEGTMQQRILDTAWPADDATYFSRWKQTRPIVLVSTDGHVPDNVTRFTPLDDGYPQLFLVTRLKRTSTPIYRGAIK